LRHVRGDRFVAQRRHEIGAVIALVPNSEG
jgi:hypothetical protein